MELPTIGSPALWLGFLGFVVAMLALDLGVFHRRAHEVRVGEALAWSAVWVSLALVFNLGVFHWFGAERGLEFLTGYVIVKALSVDNIFVFLMLFSYFEVPAAYQHRVLFWGILGALHARGLHRGRRCPRPLLPLGPLRLRYGPAEVHLLNLFAQQAAIAIENARLFEAEQRRVDQFQVIGEVGRRMTSLLAADELLCEIARLIKETLGYYLVGIALIEGKDLVFKAGAGAVWDTPDFQPPRIKVGVEGITGWVAHTGEPLLVPDLNQEPRYYGLPEASEMRSELAVPLQTKDRVIGVLHVQSDRLDAFDQSDLAVLQSLSPQAAIATSAAPA